MLNTWPCIGSTLALFINTSLLPDTKFFSLTCINVTPCSNTHNIFPCNSTNLIIAPYSLL
nr:MAG TPA: hypothetical protein [Bacteriophage sp.]